MRAGTEAIDWRRDGALAVATVAVAVAGASAATSEEAAVSWPIAATLGLVLLVVASAAVVVRRRYPTLVAVLGGICAGTYFLFVNDNIAAAIPATIGLYTLVKQGFRRRAIVVIAACTTIAVLAAVVLGDDPVMSIQRTGGRTGWMVAVMVVAELVRRRDRELSQAEERARAAEHALEETARRRAAEERLRIARELHDSLTHSISVVAVQAAVAQRMLPDRPDAAADAVGHVRAAGQDAMRDLRATLGALRISEREPAPGLADLPRLIDNAAALGVHVDLDVDGTGEVPATVGTAVYRIVQESLTNVARHSGATRARVMVRPLDGRLVVTVTDDGRGLGVLPTDGPAHLRPGGPTPDFHGDETGSGGVYSGRLDVPGGHGGIIHIGATGSTDVSPGRDVDDSGRRGDGLGADVTGDRDVRRARRGRSGDGESRPVGTAHVDGGTAPPGDHDADRRPPGNGATDGPFGGDGGHGLMGMRERVLALGGRFHIGDLPSGGTEVRAELPMLRPGEGA